jgi:hypothetical protein
MLVTECQKEHRFNVSVPKILPFHFHAKRTNFRGSVFITMLKFSTTIKTVKQTVNKGLELVY